jgi:hypothetical protein
MLKKDKKIVKDNEKKEVDDKVNKKQENKKKLKNSKEKKEKENKKKIDKSKIAVKVMACFLALLMILSITVTCIYAIINLL